MVVAGRQTRGRGRLKRQWLSDDGGLYFTMVLRPAIPAQWSYRVNFLASLTLARVIRDMLQIDARVKWPNDILVNKRKICGVLSQMEAEGDQVAYINIGVGLNVNNTPETEEPIAVSMKKLVGETIPRREVLTAFLDVFEERMAAFEPDAVIEQWKSNNLTIGKAVRVFTIKEQVDGTAVDLDPFGGLVLQLPDGGRRGGTVGDCFHR